MDYTTTRELMRREPPLITKLRGRGQTNQDKGMSPQCPTFRSRGIADLTYSISNYRDGA